MKLNLQEISSKHRKAFYVVTCIWWTEAHQSACLYFLWVFKRNLWGLLKTLQKIQKLQEDIKTFLNTGFKRLWLDFVRIIIAGKTTLTILLNLKKHPLLASLPFFLLVLLKDQQTYLFPTILVGKVFF